jgi:cytochrome c-type biogenesis protein CcmH/NrfG
LFKRGDCEGALDAYRRAKALDPKTTLSKKASAALNL